MKRWKTAWLSVFMLFCAIYQSSAHSLVAEIRWVDVSNTVYRGLLVVNSNNAGHLYVLFYNYMVGNVQVVQNAYMSEGYDSYGNEAIYLNCSYPCVSNPYISYSADHFIFYDDGSVYTQDASGKWSTMVNYEVVPKSQWRAKYLEFGVN